jgi:hypothetical protein
MPVTVESWTIGARCPAGCSAGYVGALDEAVVYSSALDAGRVAAHYHAAGY